MPKSKLDKITRIWLIKEFARVLDEQKDKELTVKRFLQLEKLYEEDGDLAKQVGRALGEHKDLFKSERKWDPRSQQVATFWSRRKNNKK